jgi:hypothetical protein
MLVCDDRGFPRRPPRMISKGKSARSIGPGSLALDRGRS